MLSRSLRRALLPVSLLCLLALAGCGPDDGVPPPTITVTDPPSALTAGDTYTIRWSSSHLGSNRLVELRADVSGASYVIASATQNDGSYTWAAGQLEGGSSLPSGDYVLVVTYYDAQGDDVWDLSSAFSLTSGAPTASVTVVDPPASLAAGSSYTIQWTSVGIGAGESVELRADVLGASYVISSGTPNDGAYTWTVGDLASGATLVSGTYNLVVTWYNPGGSDAYDLSSAFAIP